MSSSLRYNESLEWIGTLSLRTEARQKSARTLLRVFPSLPEFINRFPQKGLRRTGAAWDVALTLSRQAG
jgi:hypothetical protein